MRLSLFISVFSLYTFFGKPVAGQQHPSLMLTPKYLQSVRAGVKSLPILQQSFQQIHIKANQALALPIQVPTPKDGGGGYTHEQHKYNYQSVLSCGIAYQITQNKKYASYVKNMLLQYASQYENWPVQHPARKNGQQSGRIFWQCLNDFVWQVYMIQGYDMVFNTLTKTEQDSIENHLFLPVLQFFTKDCYETFNKINNHATWCVAAVGITGYVLQKPAYTQMALNGTDSTHKSGYWEQLNQMFSPDGYYAEGPYYERYAMYPFMLFAKAIYNYQPNLQVFGYRNQILKKAIYTTLQTTYTTGRFFPINDAIKDKTLETIELIYGANIIYNDVSADADLLGIAQQQKYVTVSDAGYRVAKDIAAKKSKDFTYKTTWINDGAAGTEGGIGILRNGSNKDQQCVVLKATSQGMNHGHFDRLNLLYFDNGSEIFSDYGAARFLNIETKGEGGYLSENETWAKQTIAHNTVVVDKTSHYKKSMQTAEKYAPRLLFFSNTDSLKVACATEAHAYDGVVLNRLVALVTLTDFERPLLVDIFTNTSTEAHQYDLPFWYQGQWVNADFTINNFSELKPLGEKYGYEHIWQNGIGELATPDNFISILHNYRFYTIHFTADNPVQVQTVFTGANDPKMNLVDSKAFIVSQKNTPNATFVNIVETHGTVDPVNETVNGAKPQISNVHLQNISPNIKEITFTTKNNKTYIIQIDYTNTKNLFTIHQQ